MDGRTEFLANSLSAKWDKAPTELDRSRSVTAFYFKKILGLRSTDITKVEDSVTDGTNDGGLDGYLIDKATKTLHLVQCKWYDKSKKKLSYKESMELFNFYANRLLPDDRSGDLRDDVRFFMTRFKKYYSRYRVKLIYLTNQTLNVAAMNQYQNNGYDIEVLGIDKMAEIYRTILSEQREVFTSGLVSLGIPDVIEIDATYSIGNKPSSIKVVQCAIRGIDLKRFFEAYNIDIFMRNLRYGLTGRINEGIKETASSDKRDSFYVLHNGISVICENFRIIEASDKDAALKVIKKLDKGAEPYAKRAIKQGVKKFIWLDKFQIVNGAQTTITLANIDDKDLEKILIPCKISKTKEDSISSFIAICNNTQNKIGPWDLVANSEELTMLQNYAAHEVVLPIFIKRKSGEKWGDVAYVSTGKPAKSRITVAKDVYQAFLSFNGSPGQAYVKKGTVLVPEIESEEPSRRAYQEISEYNDIELIVAIGLIPPLERQAAKDAANDPEFTKWWIQWAIGAYGHIYNNLLLAPGEAERAKELLLSDKSLEYWTKVRKYLIRFFKKFFSTGFKPLDKQRVLRNGEEEWSQMRIRTVKPQDIWPYINPRFRDATFPQMRRLQGSQVSVEFYEINFGILAKFMDIFIAKTPPKF